jgi:glycosyltransferase involved in cell wall biosynthesis
MEKSLRLAYIIGTYPGVTTTFIDREIRVLRQWGVDLQTVSIRRPAPGVPLSAEQREVQQNTIYLLPVDWWNFIMGNLYWGLLRPLVYFGTLIYLLGRPHPSLKDWFKTSLHFAEGVYAAYLLRGQSLDRLHAHFIDRAATVALVAGRLLNLPYSVTAHANSIYTNKVLLYEKMNEASFVVTVSEFNRSYLLDAYPGLDPNKIHVLHPWVDMSHFQPPPTRPSHDMLRILSVGRLVEKKGHQYLVEACHLLQAKGFDFECRIIGNGPLKSELQAGIERHKLEKHVYLLGAQPQTEVLANLGWCDVFVLACVIAKDGDRDGMPVSLAEAMAMAVPVVSCQILGIGEIVRPKAGLLVPPRDARALSEALQTIYALSESDRAEMGRRGRAVVDADFNLLEGTRQLMALFQTTHPVQHLTVERSG